MKKKSVKQELLEAKQLIKKIAQSGHGLKPEVIDWANVGKNTVHMARRYVAGKCVCCGKDKEYQP